MKTKKTSLMIGIALLTLVIGVMLLRSQPPPAPADEPPAAVEETKTVPPPPPLADDERLKELLKNVEQVRADPSTRTVYVGDEKIELKFTSHEREPWTLDGIDDGHQSGFFTPLVEAARAGNDQAARRLSDALDFCRYFPKSQAEFDARIAAERKRFAETGGVLAPGEAPRTWDETRKPIEEYFHRCDGVTADMSDTAAQLLRESSERSDESRLTYARSLEKTDPEAALGQYKTLWENGHLYALRALAAQGLSYQIAYTAAFIGLHDSALADKQMAAIEAQVSPSAFQQAKKEAVQLLKNPNCCKEF
jgi:hypothetical protein